LRAKKTFKNTLWGFVYEAASIACSFILPRLILTSFGSEYNGVTLAITQFLRVIALFQAGIGGVAMAALYKPLAENNVEQISVVVKSTERFLRKVALIFIGFSAILACTYPFLVIDEFGWFFTASLVMIMSISTFAQYFFGQTYLFLLNANQLQKLGSIVDTAKIIASTAISVVMIQMGFGIRAVKLGSAVVFVLAPLFISIYTKKKYKIISTVKNDNSVIRQRWDNFGQQVANFVTLNTGLIILSVFSNVFEVSVYSIYTLVMVGVYGLFAPLNRGVGAAFGNMLAKGESVLIRKNLRIYEQVVFASSAFLFSVASIMTMPFILLYTAGTADVSYHRPVLLHVMIISHMFMCFRLPYQSIVNAAGHFRQTRNPAFIETVVNIIISIAFVSKFGVIGVAVGTLFAYAFRTIWYAVYLSNTIILRSIWLLVKRLLLCFGCLLLTVSISAFIPLAQSANFYIWALNAAVISVIAFAIVAASEWIFYRDDLMSLLKMARGVLKKKPQGAA